LASMNVQPGDTKKKRHLGQEKKGGKESCPRSKKKRPLARARKKKKNIADIYQRFAEASKWGRETARAPEGRETRIQKGKRVAYLVPALKEEVSKGK